ncbi:hypothetical protein ES708_08400 [subsurface metagenome]
MPKYKYPKCKGVFCGWSIRYKYKVYVLIAVVNFGKSSLITRNIEKR